MYAFSLLYSCTSDPEGCFPAVCDPRRLLKTEKIKFSFLLRLKRFSLLLSFLKENLNYHARFPVVFSKCCSQNPGNGRNDPAFKAMTLWQHIEMTSSALMQEVLNMPPEVPHFLTAGWWLSQVIQNINSNLQFTTADFKWSGSIWAHTNLLCGRITFGRQEM